MKITRELAMRIWMERYGFSAYAEDFDGGLMFRDAYGRDDFFVWQNGEKIYCGWNIHHILPVACGGTNAREILSAQTSSQMMRQVTKSLTGSMMLCIRSRESKEQTIMKS